MKKREIPIGGFTWVTVVSPDGLEGIELALEPMGFLPAKVYQKSLFQAGTPAVAFASTDIQVEYARLKELGVVFRGEPTDVGPGTSVLFEDTCGNLVNLYRATEPPVREVAPSADAERGVSPAAKVAWAHTRDRWSSLDDQVLEYPVPARRWRKHGPAAIGVEQGELKAAASEISAGDDLESVARRLIFEETLAVQRAGNERLLAIWSALGDVLEAQKSFGITVADAVVLIDFGQTLRTHIALRPDDEEADEAETIPSPDAGEFMFTTRSTTGCPLDGMS